MAFKVIAENDKGLAQDPALDGLVFHRQMWDNAKDLYNGVAAGRGEARILSWNEDGEIEVGTAGGSGQLLKSATQKDQKVANEIVEFAAEKLEEFSYRFVQLDNEPIKFEEEAILTNVARFTPVDLFNNNGRDLKPLRGGRNTGKKIQIDPAKDKAFGSLPFSYVLSETNIKLRPLDNNSFYIDLDEPGVAYHITPSSIEREKITEHNRIALYRLEGDQIKTYLLHFKEPKFRASKGGGATNRPDPVSEVDYYWSGYPLVGRAIGLEPERFIGSTFSSDQTRQLAQQGYYLVNVPAEKPFAKTEQGMESDVYYYRKFKSPTSAKRNKPKDGLPAPPRNRAFFKQPENFESPAFFQLSQDGDKKDEEFLGVVLQHGNATERKNAGSVMGKALSKNAGFKQEYNAFKDVNPRSKAVSSVSATDFSRFMLQKANNDVQTDWEAHKEKNWTDVDINRANRPATWADLRTEQEWCHLFGHGDGGQEVLGNFVAGSKHCNTEQLAIELGQRRFHGFTAPNGAESKGQLRARITAHLFRNIQLKKDFSRRQIEQTKKFSGTKGLIQEDWYEGEDGDQKLRQNFGDLVMDSTLDITNKHKLLDLYCVVYPLARYIRYRVFHDRNPGTGSPVKIFDHTFDAQSEAFDYHEFRILETTVARIISRLVHGEDELHYKLGILVGQLRKRGIDPGMDEGQIGAIIARPAKAVTIPDFS